MIIGKRSKMMLGGRKHSKEMLGVGKRRVMRYKMLMLRVIGSVEHRTNTW